ncbi:TolC family protein [Sphingobacterium spiritivorum]|uniref:TolC family protein n=1 Tax=Sphingobacterium spiritivorum TaxID=258 RepID=UPI003DA4C5CC
MKYLAAISIFITVSFQSFAQQDSVVVRSKEQIEQQFLSSNLDLLAGKYKIEQSRAAILQAKLWPNPTFSISEVNLWKNNPVETMSPLIGNWGRNQQVALELEQLIETAGKRKKRVRLEQLNLKNQELEFEETLRNLKFDLRESVIELQKLQGQESLYQSQFELFRNLSEAFEKQWKQGNVSEMEYVRIHSEMLSFENELAEIRASKIDLIKKIKTYSNVEGPESIALANALQINNYVIPDLLRWKETALENRADFRMASNQLDISRQQLVIEKAERKPNVQLSLGYDRGGNVMPDFIGLGASIELPVFNRNQGNIRIAQLEIEKSTAELTQNKLMIVNEIDATVQRLVQLQRILEKLSGSFDKQLDLSLEKYTRNFQNRNISVMEFVDFVSSYLENKKNLIDRKEQYLKTIEELQYVIGKDI